MATSKEVYRSLTIGGFLLLSLLMLAGFIVYIAPHIGWRVDGLRSGSMSPQLNVGDLVVTRPVEAQAVSVGDIIIFHSVNKPDSFISHRVVEIKTNPFLAFKTKGDANETVDPFTIPAQNLVGELAFHAPLLGYAVLFLQTGTGLLVSLVIPGLVIIAVCLKSLRNELVKTAKKRTPARGIEQ
jgi:signal peptidase